MKFSKSILPIAAFAAVGACMAFATPAAHASLIGDYQAVNYNPTTGVWTDSSGNGNNATFTANATNTPTSISTANPTLVTSGAGATPNGSETVALAGNGSFNLTNPIAPGPYSVFVYFNPTNNGAIVGGNNANTPPAFEYRLNAGKQDTLAQYTADFGSSNTAIPVNGSAFSSIGAQLTGAGTGSTVSYFLNGASDGTTAATANAITSPLAYLFDTTNGATNGGANDGPLAGNVAEIRIYNDTGVSAASVNSAFQTAYVTGSPTIPEPATLGLLGIGGMALLKRRRKTA